MKCSWLMVSGILAGLACAALSAPAVAQDAAPSVDEIVAKTNHMAYYQERAARRA